MHEQISAAARHVGRDPDEVEVLAATKYVLCEDLPVLAAAGVRLVGENRAQDLQEKVAVHGELFEWDFIGALQSRRVRAIVPHVRLIHSVAIVSALRELERHRAIGAAGPGDPDRGQRRPRARQVRASRPGSSTPTSSARPCPSPA